MATSSQTKIPLHVNHNNEQYYRTSRNNINEGGGSSGLDNGETIYDMKNMNDETDRIKNRMKDFEDRCKRWREDFFNKTNQTGNVHHADHRAHFSDNNNNNVYSTTSSAPFTHPSPPFASSLHRSFIEETDNGGKKYKIEFDIGDFKQNELQISTQGRSLIVKGDREVKAGSATETKTFNRELTVPDYVNMEKMNAFLLDNIPETSSGNTLIVEAPIIMEKYTYRRSAFDKQSVSPARNIIRSSQPGISSSNLANTNPGVSGNNGMSTHSSRIVHGPSGTTTTSESHHTENKTTSTSTTHSTSKIVHNPGNYDESSTYSTKPSTYVHSKNNIPVGDDYLQQNSSNLSSARSNGGLAGHLSNSNFHQNYPNQSIAPELISGYPIYDNKEGCVVYKFDFSGFDQSEIHLTITVDRVLEIKACKESSDHLGKVYREFKREIQLEPEVDANLIKNLLYDGILTLKIPKPNRPDGNGSVSNNHNLHSPNGFQEFYTDEGKLAKLITDFRGYSPESIKIILSANNVLKINAQQLDSSPTRKGTVQKECSRQYMLPAWIQPEKMKAIMSRDGVLTIDFNSQSSSSKLDDRIAIN